ncbi:hypothetical protein MIND_00038300 [Mycena indigotica]|uniref:Ubiquinol-cytochrome c chaperone domain-containing protein n=1 Tax=Mycena indigotica TaxID=2126181 RepID=A0A8H6WE14_9AGAR|nr:uncharacterized protein MIND_00038300 [Mycena indigotica]KAF7315239.1 hypothetical protein MIND_00038300 [Mycena indigotica]
MLGHSTTSSLFEPTRCLSTLSSKNDNGAVDGHHCPTQHEMTSLTSCLQHLGLYSFVAVYTKSQKSPQNLERFRKFAGYLGMGSPRSLAQIRTFVLYERVCALRADEEKDFWRHDCGLPPTFQSWFTVITLHIWMMNVRFRALPSAYGRRYADCLVEHFFQDVEDRVRAIMQPTHDYKPYTFLSTFYVNPNAPKSTDKNEKLSNAPERLVSQQLKIFKEQWTGFALSLDLALVKGDMEMAATVWRNLLGARGASGIAFPDDPSAPTFRRAVNLVGGTVVNPEKVDFDKEAATDDHSGVYDFPSSEADKYLEYPQLMLDIVHYIRRELYRLEAYSDEQIVNMDWRDLKFGQIRDNAEESTKSE